MLKALLLCYIGQRIDAGFLYYAIAFILCVSDVLAAWLTDREKKQ